MLITDTDNLTYEIKSENVYEEFLSGKICLTLVVIQKIQSFLMRLIEKLLDKWKMNLAELVIEFVGLKSKMHSMKKIDGKECNTAKGVSIATEFDKFKDVLFNEKNIRHKMKRIKSKKNKSRTYEVDKIVSQIVKRLKKIVIIERNCNKKYCYDWKRLW